MSAEMQRNPVHTAAEHGDLESVRSLMESGADLDARDERGRTPLMEATHANQPVHLR